MLVDVQSQLLRPAVQTRRRAPTASMLLDLDRVGKSSQHAMASALAALVLTSSVSSPSLAATDGAAIGKCLLTNCQLPLAKCVTNPGCAANLLCIQTCTNRAPPPTVEPLPATRTRARP